MYFMFLFKPNFEVYFRKLWQFVAIKKNLNYEFFGVIFFDTIFWHLEYLVSGLVYEAINPTHNYPSQK